MNICFVSRALPVHRLGGLEHHLRDLSLALVARGHRVHIVTTSGGAKDVMFKEVRGSNFISELTETAPGDYSFRFFRELSRVIKKLHAQENFDLIIPIEFSGLFLPSQVGDTPVVPLIHGTMTTETPLHRRYWARLSFGEKLRAAWRFKGRLALVYSFWKMVRRSTWIIVDSEFTRLELMRGNGCRARPHKIRVVPLGIDFRRYPHDVPDRKPLNGNRLRICLLGRLQKMKGIEIAIRAVAQLRLRGVPFIMTLGGVGDYQREAESLADSLGLGDAVKFRGRIEPEKLGEFFGEHDVFLFPDLTQPAFGLVAVEAMRYGLPVVAARSGAIPEVVTAETGWLYEPWNVSELAALLASIATDRAGIDAKSEAGRRRVDDYSAEAMAMRMEDALEKILE